MNISLHKHASVFPRLSESSQRELAAAFHNTPPAVVDLWEARSRFSDNSFLMLRACKDSLVGVVKEALDLGVNPNIIESVNRMRTVIPLAWVGTLDPNKRHQADQIADLLLDAGAQPNLLAVGDRFQSDVSAMHASCSNPWMLEKLIAHGGDVRISSAGWSVLDQWCWHMHSPPKEQKLPGLEALDILLEHGISHDLNDGSNFLTSCWASGFLRQHIPSFIEKGFDPNVAGAKGPSLIAHLTKKVKSGKGGELAGKLVAQFNAQVLEAATPQAKSSSPSPRL